jgi:hypothetical protein
MPDATSQLPVDQGDPKAVAWRENGATVVVTKEPSNIAGG